MNLDLDWFNILNASTVLKRQLRRGHGRGAHRSREDARDHEPEPAARRVPARLLGACAAERGAKAKCCGARSRSGGDGPKRRERGVSGRWSDPEQPCDPAPRVRGAVSVGAVRGGGPLGLGRCGRRAESLPGDADRVRRPERNRTGRAAARRRQAVRVHRRRARLGASSTASGTTGPRWERGLLRPVAATVSNEDVGEIAVLQDEGDLFRAANTYDLRDVTPPVRCERRRRLRRDAPGERRLALVAGGCVDDRRRRQLAAGAGVRLSLLCGRPRQRVRQFRRQHHVRGAGQRQHGPQRVPPAVGTAARGAVSLRPRSVGRRRRVFPGRRRRGHHDLVRRFPRSNPENTTTVQVSLLSTGVIEMTFDPDIATAGRDRRPLPGTHDRVRVGRPERHRGRPRRRGGGRGAFRCSWRARHGGGGPEVPADPPGRLRPDRHLDRPARAFRGVRLRGHHRQPDSGHRTGDPRHSRRLR